MRNKNKIITKQYNSPFGNLLLGAYNEHLCLCDWLINNRKENVDLMLKRRLFADYIEDSSDIIDYASKQLDEYFLGIRKNFDVPLLLNGTDFQKHIWNCLLLIPYGNMVSYSEIANIAGKPKAMRAIDNTIASNAISIFIPCHRVIGKNNTLTGYRGGLITKQSLLTLEKQNYYTTLF